MGRYICLIGIVIIAFTVTGCYSQYGTQYSREEIPPDSTAMSIDDVIKLSKEGLSDDVIISQLHTTYSYFALSTDDIVELKNDSVSEKVINAMIKSSEAVKDSRMTQRYYGNPWYSSIYFGLNGRRYNNYSSFSRFPFYTGHFNRGYRFGGNSVRGNISGRRRSSGSHR